MSMDVIKNMQLRLFIFRYTQCCCCCCCLGRLASWPHVSTGFDHKRKVITTPLWKFWEQTTSITFLRSHPVRELYSEINKGRLLMLLFPASHWLETLGSFEARNQSRLSYSRNCWLLDITCSEIIRSASLSYMYIDIECIQIYLVHFVTS